MIEAMLVSNNADVCQVAEEHERPKLKLLFRGRRLEALEQGASTRSLEVDARRVIDGPHKSGAVVTVWTSCAPAIWRSQSLVNRGHQLRFKLEKAGARRRRGGRKVDCRLWFSFPGRFGVGDDGCCHHREIIGRAGDFVYVAAGARYSWAGLGKCCC